MLTKTNDSSSGSIEAEEALSTVFKLLSHHRRRVVVTYLATQAGSTSVSDVADQITLFEGGHTHDRYERSCTSLVHAHLPMLTDASVIEYDPDLMTVELRGRGTDLLQYLN